jgi:hypothetical protein
MAPLRFAAGCDNYFLPPSCTPSYQALLVHAARTMVRKIGIIFNCFVFIIFFLKFALADAIRKVMPTK